MDFDFKLRIDDKIIEDKIKQALLSEVNAAVKTTVYQQMNKYQSNIEHAVKVYLEKRMTDEYMKKEIDEAAQRVIEDRLRDY